MATSRRKPSNDISPAAPEPLPATPPDGASEPPPQDEREEMIRRAAYAAYERRGHLAGGELDDWLEAEQEIDRGTGTP